MDGMTGQQSTFIGTKQFCERPIKMCWSPGVQDSLALNDPLRAQLSLFLHVPEILVGKLFIKIKAINNS